MEINEDNYWAWIIIGMWFMGTVLGIVFRRKKVGEPYREPWEWVKYIQRFK